MGIGENIGENVGQNTGSSGHRLIGGADWQLAAGHYYDAITWTSTVYSSQTAADTAAFVIFPRPNTESASHARQRWAHTGFDYEIPICVRGGAFPYKAEIDTVNTSPALTGISIGEFYDSIKPFIVNIPQSTISGLSTLTDYDIYVKMTDQTGKELKVWWSFQLEANDLDHFFFVDDTAAPAGNGSFSTPFDSAIVAGWLAAGDGANSSLMTLVIKEGDSQTTPYLKSGSWNITNTSFPTGIINIPGETPKIDLESADAFFGTNQGCSDVFVRGVEAINGQFTNTDGQGAFVNGFNSIYHRVTITDNIFDGVNSWNTGETNNGFLTWDGNSTYDREYLAVVGNTFKNGAGSSSVNNGFCVGLMMWKYYLIDNNLASDLGTGASGASALVYHKHGVTDGTVRRWEAITNIDIDRGALWSDDTTNTVYLHQNTEWSHNNIKTSVSRQNITFPGGITTGGPYYAFRNTLQEGFIDITYQTVSNDVEVMNNVVGGTNDLVGAVGVLVNTDNYENVLPASFNADGTLTDVYLSSITRERGEVGHEIA